MNALVLPILPVLGSLGAIGVAVLSMVGALRKPENLSRVWIKLGVHLAVLALLVAVGAAGPVPLGLLATAVALRGWFELLRALEARFGPVAGKTLLMGVGAALPLVPVLAHGRGAMAIVALVAFQAALAVPLLAARRPAPLHGVLAAGFGILFVSLPLAILVDLAGRNYGVYAFFVLVVMSHDGFGEGLGRLVGRGALWPEISPGKTLGGTVGALLAALAVAAWVGFLVPWGLTERLAIAAGIVALAVIGDLVESALKREIGIKDFGTLLPAHGGVLDRFDSLLFAAPGVYGLASLLGVLAGGGH